MAFNVNEMRSQLTFGGARSSLFQVRLQNPVNALADLKTPFMCKAASLPGQTLGTIEVPYFGRKIKLPGDRTYEPWQVTIINDEDFLIRNALEQWSHAINSPEGNIRSLTTYVSQAQVLQYSKTGTVIREYTFHNLHPSNVDPIEVNWETTDTIEEFQVTFQYDWFTVTGGITGNAGGQ